MLAAAIVLTSCAEEDAVLDSGANGNSGSSSPGSTTPQTSKPDDDESATTPQAEPAIAPTGAACLVGSWRANNELFMSSVESMGSLEFTDFSGEVIISFLEDGSQTVEYRDWLWSVEAEGQVMSFHRTGVDHGSWSATDSELSFRDERMGSMIEVTGGFDMTLDPEPDERTNVPYTCDSTLTTLTMDGFAHELHRR